MDRCGLGRTEKPEVDGSTPSLTTNRTPAAAGAFPGSVGKLYRLLREVKERESPEPSAGTLSSSYGEESSQIPDLIDHRASFDHAENDANCRRPRLQLGHPETGFVEAFKPFQELVDEIIASTGFNSLRTPCLSRPGTKVGDERLLRLTLSGVRVV
jgi:hypothetical protein